MENLKKKCMNQRIITAIVLAIIGIVIVACTKFVAFKALSVTKLTGESDFEALEGKYVSYEMKMPMDYYETFGTINEDTRKETINQYGYFVYDTEGKFFFGVVRDKAKDAETEAMIDQLWDYWNYESDEAPKSVTIKGTLTAMDYQDRGFFDDTVEYYEEYGITADLKYYYIEEGRVNGDRISTAVVMTILGIGLIVIGIVWWLYGKKSWDKNLKKYAAGNDNTYSQLVNEINSGNVMNGGSTIIGDRFLFTADSVVNMCPMENVCWGYYYRRTGRNSISQMRLYYANGGMFTVNASQKNTEEMLQYIYEKFPFVVVGYSKDWEKMYNKDRQAFLNLRFNEGKQQINNETPDDTL